MHMKKKEFSFVGENSVKLCNESFMKFMSEGNIKLLSKSAESGEDYCKITIMYNDKGAGADA